MGNNQFKLCLKHISRQNLYALITMLQHLWTRPKMAALLLPVEIEKSGSEVSRSTRQKCWKRTMQLPTIYLPALQTKLFRSLHVKQYITLYTQLRPTSHTNATPWLDFSTVGLFWVQQSDPARHTSTGSSLRGASTARAEILLATPDASACHWLGVGSVSLLVGVVHYVNDRRLKETAWNKETKDPTIWAAK